MTKYFDIPFASAGDKTAIPNTVQPGGEVSYPEGWTADYEAEQGVAPNAKDVDRQKENQFKFDISEAMKEVQERGILPYRADINYPVDAIVIASDSNQYRSLVANGPATSVVDPVGNPVVWSNLSQSGATVTSSGSNANGHYRIWSDGFIEQWGDVLVITDDTLTTFSYPVTYAVTPTTAPMAVIDRTSSIAGLISIFAHSLSTNQFQLLLDQSSANGNNTTVAWSQKGY